MKRTSALIVWCAVLIGCGAEPPVLEISGRFWPEGSSILALREGKQAAASSLFGDRLKLVLPKSGVYIIRAAHPEFLTAFTPEIEVESGAFAGALPVPVARRRIGAVNLGLGYTSAGLDSISAVLLEIAPESFSTAAFEPHKGVDTKLLVQRAHAKAIEVIFRGDFRKIQTARGVQKEMSRLTETAVGQGADGVELIPGSQLQTDGSFPKMVGELAANVHERGLTLAVGIAPEALEKLDPVRFFVNIPASESPDELVLLCEGTGLSGEEVALVSTAQIENALLKIREANIPFSRISVEVRLGAVAWAESGGKSRRPAPLRAGDLERIRTEAGESSVLRLGDGSLRLAYKGVNYSFDDLAGIAGKMEFLRTGDFARVRGVRIILDGSGLKPDPEGMRKLAEVFGR